jgi:hypothetical protein
MLLSSKMRASRDYVSEKNIQGGRVGVPEAYRKRSYDFLCDALFLFGAHFYPLIPPKKRR